MEHTFRATGYEAALAGVRKDLGPDAVILGTRQLNGRHGVEVEIRARPSTVADSQSLAPLERRLEQMGVPTRAATTLARAIAQAHGGVPASLRKAREAVCRVLGREMIFGGPIASESRVVALVGPTGVGKTTTIAKLAAHAALVERRRVALVCLDQYRVGGLEQLQRYADLIDLPLESAEDLPSLRRALGRVQSAELVLIDTAGRSPRDHAAHARVGGLLRAAGEPVEVHLGLPAQLREAELRATLDAHVEPLQPRRLFATKLDEAVYHGGIVAAQIIAGIPFSYFTTGQRVPEDIEIASATRLAGLLCGEEVCA